MSVSLTCWKMGEKRLSQWVLPRWRKTAWTRSAPIRPVRSEVQRRMSCKFWGASPGARAEAGWKSAWATVSMSVVVAGGMTVAPLPTVRGLG